MGILNGRGDTKHVSKNIFTVNLSILEDIKGFRPL